MAGSKKLYLIISAVIAAVMATVIYRGDKFADEVFVGKPLYSPDHKHKAILFSENGGGAISPYCFDYVSVVPVSVEDTKANTKAFHVYEGACHSLGFSHSNDKAPVLENAPLLNWKNDAELEVTFDRQKASVGINRFLFISQADDGRVRVIQREFQ